MTKKIDLGFQILPYFNTVSERVSPELEHNLEKYSSSLSCTPKSIGNFPLHQPTNCCDAFQGEIGPLNTQYNYFFPFRPHALSDNLS